MSNIITDYINTVEDCRVSLKNILQNNNLSISSNPTLQECTEKINSVINNYNNPLINDKYRVRYFDADGTLLKEEYVADGGTTTPPSNPNIDPDYLTFRCWASCIGEVFTDIQHDIDYGACYLTKDDATYLFITLTEDTGLTFSFGLKNYGLSTNTNIDWGDTNTSIKSTNNTEFLSHTYDNYGNYIIKIWNETSITPDKYWCIEGTYDSANDLSWVKDGKNALTKLYARYTGAYYSSMRPTLFTNYQWGVVVEFGWTSNNNNQRALPASFIIPPYLTMINTSISRTYVLPYFNVFGNKIPTLIIDKNAVGTNSDGNSYIYYYYSSANQALNIKQEVLHESIDLLCDTEYMAFSAVSTTWSNLKKVVIRKNINLGGGGLGAVPNLNYILFRGPTRSVTNSILNRSVGAKVKQLTYKYRDNIYTPTDNLFTYTTQSYQANMYYYGTAAFIEDLNIPSLGNNKTNFNELGYCASLKELYLPNEFALPLYLSSMLTKDSAYRLLNSIKDLTNEPSIIINCLTGFAINLSSKWFTIYSSGTNSWIEVPEDYPGAISLLDAINLKNWTISPRYIQG